MVRHCIALVAIAALLLGCSQDDGAKTTPAAAAPGTVGVTISSPADQAVVNASTVTVTYEVRPSPNGDHIHIYVDDRKPDVLRKLKGSYEVADLTPGTHTVVIKEVNAGHTPTGYGATVRFTVAQ